MVVISEQNLNSPNSNLCHASVCNDVFRYSQESSLNFEAKNENFSSFGMGLIKEIKYPYLHGKRYANLRKRVGQVLGIGNL